MNALTIYIHPIVWVTLGTIMAIIAYRWKPDKEEEMSRVIIFFIGALTAAAYTANWIITDAGLTDEVERVQWILYSKTHPY